MIIGPWLTYPQFGYLDEPVEYIDEPVKLDKGTKNDTGKPEYDRLSYQALGIMNAVHKFGDEKYEKGNWKKGLHFTRMCNAAIRHISAIMNGQLFDEESKMMHSAHAAVTMEMLTHFLANHQQYKDFDDITEK